jgi:hypothetical protein
VLTLTQHTTLRGVPPQAAPSNISNNSTLPATILDLAAVPHLIALGSPNASLALQNLTLINPPPGPPSTYPLGLSTLMMWTVSLVRSPQTPGCNGSTSAAAVVVKDCVLGLPDEGGMQGVLEAGGLHNTQEVRCTTGCAA